MAQEATLPWLRYANQGATRNKPVSATLSGAMSFLPEMGITMEVFSGGQDGIGEGDQRTGSTRHDHGDAADVFFYKDGQKLDWANPDHVPIFREIVAFTPPNRAAVCIEPYTCPTDAINLNSRGIDCGWRTLGPGSEFHTWIDITAGLVLA